MFGWLFWLWMHVTTDGLRGSSPSQNRVIVQNDYLGMYVLKV